MPITISNTFVPATRILSSEVNENFQDVVDQAVTKSGDTMTGALVTTGVVISGTGAAALDVAGGVNAGTGNVSIIGTDGRIPALTSTYFASLDASTLTGISSHDGENAILASQVFS